MSCLDGFSPSFEVLKECCFLTFPHNLSNSRNLNKVLSLVMMATLIIYLSCFENIKFFQNMFQFPFGGRNHLVRFCTLSKCFLFSEVTKQLITVHQVGCS